MKLISLLKTCSMLLGLLAAAGCASYKIHPTASSITAPKAPAAIPVVIGITHTEQKASGGFPDLVPGIKQTLDESGLFQAVYYPVRASDPLQGELLLRLNGRFKADRALSPKAFITGFFMFLPVSFVTYNHQYQAEATVDLLKNGRNLKTYKAEAVVSVSHKLFAPPDRLEAEGVTAASRLLSANLAAELINDRAFLEKELAMNLSSKVGAN